MWVELDGPPPAASRERPQVSRRASNSQLVVGRHGLAPARQPHPGQVTGYPGCVTTSVSRTTPRALRDLGSRHTKDPLNHCRGTPNDH